MTNLNHSTPGFFEKKIEKETAARVAAFLRGLGLDVENTGSTGVRADWMEQDGPAVFSAEKMEAALAVPLVPLPIRRIFYTDTMHRRSYQRHIGTDQWQKQSSLPLMGPYLFLHFFKARTRWQTAVRFDFKQKKEEKNDRNFSGIKGYKKELCTGGRGSAGHQPCNRTGGIYHPAGSLGLW